MATRSTIPSVRAQLVTLLQAKPALSAVGITESYPGDTLKEQLVYMGSVRGSSVVPVSRPGRARRQESYTLDVWIHVSRGGQSPKDSEVRIFEILGELEDVIADDLQIGLPQLIKATIGDFEETTFYDENKSGWGASLRVGVEVEARLT